VIAKIAEFLRWVQADGLGKSEVFPWHLNLSARIWLLHVSSISIGSSVDVFVAGPTV
jgi:hypothetical protein